MAAVRKDIAALPTKTFLKKGVFKFVEIFNEKFEEKEHEIDMLKEHPYLNVNSSSWNIWKKNWK